VTYAKGLQICYATNGLDMQKKMFDISAGQLMH